MHKLFAKHLHLLLCCLFLLPIIFSLPHEEISEHNLKIQAQNSPSKILPKEISAQAPTISNPTEYAYFFIGPASPSISSISTQSQNTISSPATNNLSHPAKDSSAQEKNYVSTLSPPKFYYAWGEFHPSKFSIKKESSPLCPQDLYEFEATGKPNLEGKFIFSLENTQKEILFDASAKLPVSSSFSKEEYASLSTKKGENNSAILPKLIVNFVGILSIQYDVKHTYYERINSCSGGFCSSSCQPAISEYVQTFQIPLKDKKEWLVQHSVPEVFLLQPIDGEQLQLNEKAQALILSNSQASSISFSINNKTIANAKFADYEIVKDDFGFLQIKRIEKSQPLLSEENNSSLFANSSNFFLNASHFGAKPSAWQYYSSIKTPLPAGYSNLTLNFVDDFNNLHKKTFLLQTRIQPSISKEGEIFYQNFDAPAKEGQLQKTSIGYLLEETAFSRPAQEFFKKEISLPDLTGALAIFVAVLLGLGFFSLKN